MKILRKTDVVDAGALGFVLLIQGVLNSIQKGSRIQSEHLNISYQLEKIEALKKDVDRPLIAILTLNTIAHTVGAILVGKQAEQLYGSGDGYGVFIVSAVMTILILVASEIIPKTIGATYWKSLANFTTKALNRIIIYR